MILVMGDSYTEKSQLEMSQSHKVTIRTGQLD